MALDHGRAETRHPDSEGDSESDSDYGFDLSRADELELIALAAACEEAAARRTSPPGPAEPRAATDADAPPTHADGAAAVHAAGGDAAMASRGRRRGRGRPAAPPAAAASVCYPDLSRALSELDGGSAAPAVDDDARSPLQRFRSFPRKPLSVSDLTSGAWCELQYWYTLTRLPGGRRTRTPAMKEGSRAHQKLEDQVHTTVRVDVMSKEEAFALRLWNLVQGLTTLRETGLTRELEVWGLVDDGVVVNGIIDGVSHDNPNPEFEQELSSQESQQDPKRAVLTDCFPPKGGWPDAPRIYLTDIKTRRSLAPVSKALLRPAKIQLLLYHRFLSEMAAGALDFLQLFARYGLDPDGHFGDAFLAQVGDLHEEIFYDAPSSPVEPPDGHDAPSDAGADDASDSSRQASALRYQTLRELLPLVRREFQLTFPDGRDSLGHMLRVQYIHRDDGRELDVHDFPVSRQALDAYLDRYMGWWRGERDAVGVDIEEAFKCRTCEFAADCSWRQSMDEARVRGAHRRMGGQVR